MNARNTEAMLDAAAAAFVRLDYPACKRHLEDAMAQPDAADHYRRIRRGRDMLIRAGGLDTVWVPAVSHWRACPALGACPAADRQCADRCDLEAAGWPQEDAE